MTSSNLLDIFQVKMESLQLVVNHSWSGFICKSRPTRFYCTDCDSSDHIKRNWKLIKNSLLCLGTLCLSSVKSAISLSPFHHVIYQLFQGQEALVSLKKQSFLDPTGRFEMDFGRNLGLVTDVRRGEILGYRVLEISLILAKDVQG